MAFGDIAKKAQQLLNDDRVKNALKSERAEGVSDKILDGVAGAANKVTGGKHADKIDGARDAADAKIGTPDAHKGTGADGTGAARHTADGHSARHTDPDSTSADRKPRDR